MSPQAIEGTVEQREVPLNQDHILTNLQAIEGTVEQGQIRLKNDVYLPDHTKVYVIVPDDQPDKNDQRALHVSPGFSDPDEASGLEQETTEDGIDARV